MAAPLSGIATQQQTPAAQTLQPAAADQSRAVRQPEQTPEENTIQPRDAATGQSQEPTLSAEDFREQISQLSNDSEQSTAPPRGSVLDTSV